MAGETDSTGTNSGGSEFKRVSGGLTPASLEKGKTVMVRVVFYTKKRKLTDEAQPETQPQPQSQPRPPSRTPSKPPSRAQSPAIGSEIKDVEKVRKKSETKVSVRKRIAVEESDDEGPASPSASSGSEKEADFDELKGKEKTLNKNPKIDSKEDSSNTPTQPAPAVAATTKLPKFLQFTAPPKIKVKPKTVATKVIDKDSHTAQIPRKGSKDEKKTSTSLTQSMEPAAPGPSRPPSSSRPVTSCNSGTNKFAGKTFSGRPSVTNQQTAPGASQQQMPKQPADTVTTMTSSSKDQTQHKQQTDQLKQSSSGTQQQQAPSQQQQQVIEQLKATKANSKLAILDRICDELQKSPHFQLNASNSIDLSGSFLAGGNDQYDFYDMTPAGEILINQKIPIFPEEFPQGMKERPLSWWGILDPEHGCKRRHRVFDSSTASEEISNTAPEAITAKSTTGSGGGSKGGSENGDGSEIENPARARSEHINKRDVRGGTWGPSGTDARTPADGATAPPWSRHNKRSGSCERSGGSVGGGLTDGHIRSPGRGVHPVVGSGGRSPGRLDRPMNRSVEPDRISNGVAGYDGPRPRRDGDGPEGRGPLPNGPPNRGLDRGPDRPPGWGPGPGPDGRGVHGSYNNRDGFSRSGADRQTNWAGGARGVGPDRAPRWGDGGSPCGIGSERKLNWDDGQRGPHDRPQNWGSGLDGVTPRTSYDDRRGPGGPGGPDRDRDRDRDWERDSGLRPVERPLNWGAGGSDGPRVNRAAPDGPPPHNRGARVPNEPPLSRRGDRPDGHLNRSGGGGAWRRP